MRRVVEARERRVDRVVAIEEGVQRLLEGGSDRPRDARYALGRGAPSNQLAEIALAPMSPEDLDGGVAISFAGGLGSRLSEKVHHDLPAKAPEDLQESVPLLGSERARISIL